jgi:hypothetical protein
MPDDTLKAPLLIDPTKDAAGDWFSDYEYITGEPFSVSSLLRRVHSDDIRALIREWVRAETTGRLRVEYRILNRGGEYVQVRGDVRRVGDRPDQWVGTMRIIGRKDTAVMSSKIIRFAKNAAAIAVGLDGLAYLITYFL